VIDLALFAALQAAVRARGLGCQAAEQAAICDRRWKGNQIPALRNPAAKLSTASAAGSHLAALQ